MTTTSVERDEIAALKTERDDARAVADRWRDLCEKATAAAGAALVRAEEADAEIRALRARLAEAASGISIRGWWCMPCGSFNGEEHSVRVECRSCGRRKAVRS